MDRPTEDSDTTGYRPGRAKVGLAIGSRPYREALARVLCTSPDIHVTDLGDGPVERLTERLLDLSPDVALVDLPSGDDAALIRETHRVAPTVRMIALNQEEDVRSVLALFETGLTGYLPRSCSVEDVRSAIRDALAGELHCPPRIVAAIVRRLNEVGGQKGRNGGPNVSPKQAQVLSLLDAGLTNKEIAQRLGVEESTVKNHVHNILLKFGVHRRREAVQRYRREEIDATPLPEDPESPRPS